MHGMHRHDFCRKTRERRLLKLKNRNSTFQNPSPRCHRSPQKLVLEDTAKLAEGNRATVILALGALCKVESCIPDGFELRRILRVPDLRTRFSELRCMCVCIYIHIYIYIYISLCGMKGAARGHLPELPVAPLPNSPPTPDPNQKRPCRSPERLCEPRHAPDGQSLAFVLVIAMWCHLGHCPHARGSSMRRDATNIGSFWACGSVPRWRGKWP